MYNLPLVQLRIPGRKNDTRVITKAGDELIKRDYELALVCLSHREILDVNRRPFHCKLANTRFCSVIVLA